MHQTQPNIPPTDMAAWRGLLRVHAVLLRRLDDELQERHGLPLTSYDVLLHLAWAPGRRRRMKELAEDVMLSRSGLTRVVDELERQQYVRRESAEEDGRGVDTVLSRAGLAKLRAASRTHLDGIQRHFLDRLDPEQRAALVDAWRSIEPGYVEALLAVRAPTSARPRPLHKGSAE
jgi:DNA-binding MarR family transcriptional regulator